MRRRTAWPEDEDLMQDAMRYAEPDVDQAAVAPARASAMPVVRGVPLEVECSGAVWWATERLLVVADLHLEKGSSYAGRGQLIPPYDTAATLARLAAAIARRNPATVIALGDSFHDQNAAQRLSSADRAALAAMMAGRDWMWIAGNHDPDPPKELGGDCAAELAIGPLVFRHEPAPGAPHIDSADGGDGAAGEIVGEIAGEIAGHLHPAARVRARGRSVRRRCLASDGRRAILPAFGAYTGGLNVRGKAFSGLFDEARLNVWMLGADTVYRVPRRRLCLGV